MALQQTVIIRQLDGRLAWYPPGCGDQPTWLDDAAAREQLAAVLAEQRGNACFAAPGEELSLQSVAISPEERRHFVGSLPFMLEEQLATDVDELHFVSQPQDKLNFAVAICSQQQMSQWQLLLADFPGVNRWTPEPLLLPWSAGEWCLVLEQGRCIARTGACTGFSIEAALLPVLLASELQESGTPSAVVVYGSDQDKDLALLPESLQSLAQWRRGGFNSALMVAGDAAEALNLRQGEYSPQLPIGKWWRQWRSVAALLIAAFVAQLLATYVDYRQLQQENLSLRTAVQDSYRTANPRGAVVDAEKQLRRQLESLRGSGQTSGFVSLVDRVSQVLADQPGTAIASINYNERGGEMRLNIQAASFDAVEAIRQGINRAGLRAEMESSSAKGDGVRARIRVGEPT
jgi:general secretion pathway protein L